MENHEAVKAILLEVMYVGLLRIRASAYDGDAEACAIEADHLHNLPGIIREQHCSAQLAYYYGVERIAYLKHEKSNASLFQSCWEQLAKIIGSEDSPQLT